MGKVKSVQLEIANSATVAEDAKHLNCRKLSIYERANVEEKTTFAGIVEIGDNSSIGAGSYIEDCYIAKNCHLGKNTKIYGSPGISVVVGFPEDPNLPCSALHSYDANITIKDGVTIHEGVHIHQGVVIHEGVTIEKGAIIEADIPADCTIHKRVHVTKGINLVPGQHVHAADS